MTIIDIDEARDSTNSELNASLFKTLEGLREEHIKMEEELFQQTDHQLFPAHILYLSILCRSLEQLEGFLLLFKERQYGNCIVFLRMQMDSIMRFYGVLISEDMHETANQIANGSRLSGLKDKNGKKMYDGYLHACLDKMNPGFSHDYDYACGFVHFSQEHFLQLLNRSWDADCGETNLRVGSDYEHMDESDATKLLVGFFKYTNGILKLREWLEEESKKYNLNELRLRYRRLD